MNKSETRSTQKKNVSFIVENSNSHDQLNFDSMSDMNDSRNKGSILKNNSNQRSSISPTASSVSSQMFSPKANELENAAMHQNQSNNEKSSDSDILVSASNSTKNKKTEGYEILVSFYGLYF
jgi:hypothetical protein